MSFRKTVFVLTLVSASIPAAFATSGNTRGGEVAFENHPVQVGKSRADVQKELKAFRANPVTSNGATLRGGDFDSTFPQHSYAFQDGKLVHTDTLSHNAPKPSLAMTDAERRLFKEPSGY